MNQLLAQTTPARQKRLWAWFLLAAVAFLPFILRLGLDTEIVKQQAVLELYQGWRWSKTGSKVAKGSEISFERIKRLSVDEDYFEAQLQRDFILKNTGKGYKIRAFFAQDSKLRARIELWDPQSGVWEAWTGDSRLTNNGILLGPWVTLFFLLAGAGAAFSVIFGLGTSLVWASKWNLLEVPSYLYNFISDLFQEAYRRSISGEWFIQDMYRLPEISSFLWIVVTALVLLAIRKPVKRLRLHQFLVLSFLLEPIMIWGSSQFAVWSDDASWWKIYLGSFCYRFFSFSILLLYLMDRKYFQRAKEASRTEFLTKFNLGLAAPIVFLICKGWSWLSSVLLVSVGDSLMKLKVFLVGLLLGFMLGSRVFSMWLGCLALALILPPTKGHWFAASLCGFFFDAVLLGWFMSPFKTFSPSFLHLLPIRSFMAVFVITWVFGVFLTSVGVNIAITWLLLILVLWAYSQLSQLQQDSGQSSSVSS
ncbi:hypothetical protein GW915_01720 [bacterium]|nr:hypothetical protein [bacterium]